jgi:hypothetical protein
MPLIRYVDKRLNAKTLAIVERANVIIAEYAARGYSLTLRQVYYQFVARGYIENNIREYQKLGNAINDGRLVGLIDWNAIVDRTRNLQSVAHWTDPSEIVGAVARQFRIDKWETQRFRPEVWIEKDALVGVIERVCKELDVPFFSCRGYTSQSEMWAGAMRLERYKDAGQEPYIMHFGDHDPSGKDMSRDIVERMDMFMGGVAFERLALNMDQIEEYNPPPNYAKITDARANAYIAEFGEQSWELDALEPEVIASLIRNTIEGLRDETKWAEKVAEEKEHRKLLRKASDRWESVVSFLSDDEDDTTDDSDDEGD